jgi:hypothetical protein
MAKVTYNFRIEKNTGEGGAWLASFNYKNPAGIETSAYTAWRSLPAAKRWAAQGINRKSIRWAMNDDKTLALASVDVKTDA